MPQWGSDGVLTWSYRLAPWPVPLPYSVCVCVCVVCARIRIYRWPPAYAGKAIGCMRVCARSHAECYVHARPCVLCVMCTYTTWCHSQYKGAKEQCGPLFLSERKNELSAPGVQLLGWAGSSWAHIPPACSAPSRGQHCKAPPFRTPGPVCPGDSPPAKIRRWLAWSGPSLLALL